MSARSKRALILSRRYGYGLFNLITLSEERTLAILAVLVGLTSGISAFFFKHMIDGVHHLCCASEISEAVFTGHWYRMILPAVGGLLGGLVIYYFAKEA